MVKYYVPKVNKNFVGRAQEKSKISEIIKRKEPALLVFYGRRRTGKTELVEQVFKDRNILKFEGLENGDKEVQIQSVMEQIAHYTGKSSYLSMSIASWRQVFRVLVDLTEDIDPCTLYFEELQWLANYEEELISELKFFWDNHFRHNQNLIVILCGSAPSFFINKVIRSKALYNRSMHSFRISPLSLKETSLLLPKFNKLNVLEAYLIVGGIPEYLKYLSFGSSAILEIAKESFTSNGFFFNELERIFVSSLSKKPEYRQIINYLAKNKFANRKQILSACNLSSGRQISEILNDLIECDFVSKYASFETSNTVRNLRYQIKDNYLQFYYKFIAPVADQIQLGNFEQDPLTALNMNSYNIWRGFAFERFCRQISKKIAEILQFARIKYKSGACYSKSTEDNFQIDLIYKRSDHTYTICEIKFLDSDTGSEIITPFEEKIRKANLKTNYNLEKILITAGEIKPDLRQRAYFDYVIKLDDLFL